MLEFIQNTLHSFYINKYIDKVGLNFIAHNQKNGEKRTHVKRKKERKETQMVNFATQTPAPKVYQPNMNWEMDKAIDHGMNAHKQWQKKDVISE